MSKMDNQRAMREAKYARDQAAAAARRPATAKKDAPVAPPVDAPAARTTRSTKASRATPATDAADGPLCGHASMNGRTCTRPAGHSEKSHRYS